MAQSQYRLVTRSDFDGLVCAVLLKELDMIDEIVFVHPKDMQDGKVEITDRDITTNLPYVAKSYLAFDHHSSENTRTGGSRPANLIIDAKAPSAARVVYNHFGGKRAFPRVKTDMLDAVDKGDTANFTKDEVLNPSGWVLLNFLMDARTNLGRFKSFRMSNYQLMMQLIDDCRKHTIDEILKLPDVAERVQLYVDHADKFRDQITRCTTVHKNVAVLDLRNEETIFAGNRFVIYALYPQCNLSIHALWGLNKQNTVFAIGKSILNKTSKTNVGDLALTYGGGGHEAAGTCQVANDQAEKVLKELIAKANQDG